MADLIPRRFRRDLRRLAIGAVIALDLLLSGATLEVWPRVAATPDPTDLLALPALGVAYLLGSRAADGSHG